MKATIKLFLAIFILVLFGGCARCQTMDPCDFARIECGDSIDDIVQCAGCPYEICRGCDGQVKYVYTVRERPNRYVQERTHYVITVQDGLVVDKSICREEYQNMYRIDRDSTFDEWDTLRSR